MTDLHQTFSGTTAVVTGSGSGIGAAVARAAAEVGMRVVLADLDAARLEAVRAELAASGAEVLAVPTDVGDPDAVIALAEAAHDAFGSVELLVNNAGIESVGRLREMSPESWQRLQRVNVNGTFNGIRAFVGRMGANPRPTYVVNVASVAAISSTTMNTAYMASKHAVLAMTECLYLECQEEFPRMSVSVVCPAAVSTRIFEDALTDTAGETATEATLGVMRGHLRTDGITPAEAARSILEGAAERRFWILPHPDVFARLAARRAAMLTDLLPPSANVAQQILERGDQVPGAV